MIRTRPRPQLNPSDQERMREWQRRYDENRDRAMRDGTREPDWATRTAREAIRGWLHAMSFGKCVFCEGLVDAQDFGAIEHYHPRRHYRQFAFEWSNLYLSCTKCNTAKSDADHKGALFRPDQEDPEPLLWMDISNGKLEPHPGASAERTRRAEESIRLLDLNRGALCSLRYDTWLKLKLTMSLVAEGHGDVEDLRIWLTPSQQYKWVIRFLLTEVGFPDLAAEDRRQFLEP